MKQSNYKTLSQVYEIEDKDISKILNYLERHATSIEWKPENKDGFEEMEGVAIVDGVKWYFNFSNVTIHDEEYLEIPTKWLADNIVGIYRNIKDLK